MASHERQEIQSTPTYATPNQGEKPAPMHRLLLPPDASSLSMYSSAVSPRGTGTASTCCSVGPTDAALTPPTPASVRHFTSTRSPV